MMGWLAAATALLAAPTTPRSAVAEIRALRAQSNAAIAAHDSAALGRLLTPDFTVLPGSSGTPSDRTATLVRFDAAFADPTFITYVRTPRRITVATSGKRAAEVGRWVGRWRGHGKTLRLSGVYQATWVPTAAGWRMRNESFVSLACTGGSRCSSLF